MARDQHPVAEDELDEEVAAVEVVEQVQRLRGARALGVDVLDHGVDGDDDAVVLPVAEVDEDLRGVEPQPAGLTVGGDLVAQTLARPGCR